MYQASQSAIIDSKSIIGEGVSIWHQSQVREFSTIGSNTIIGSGVYIDKNVKIGQNCKIQNLAQIFFPAEIADGVFLGPGCLLTNDRYPRATNPNLELKSILDWNPVGVKIQQGASIGAGSVLVAPVKIGKWALIAAGSIVTRDVPDFAVYAGNPARFIKWVGRSGMPLKKVSPTTFECPISSDSFELIDSRSLVLK
jgi:UDP-2-acetamido-3-amino-2,3-dideoxy-glucuronate N-acetyltransferase